jgi:hypothetical protein
MPNFSRCLQHPLNSYLFKPFPFAEDLQPPAVNDDLNRLGAQVDLRKTSNVIMSKGGNVRC